MAGETVLVTGGTGFIGAHCVVQLLQAGYRVRTTVRSLSRTDEVRALAVAGGVGVEAAAGIDVVAADLTADEGWTAAVDGARFVLHVASPFPVTQSKDPDELIVPARDGAIRVLRASRDADVERVVLTSSFAAVGYGRPHPGRAYTEDDWTDEDDPGISAYVRSKTIAEHAAWQFIDREGGELELAVVNPVGVFGPALGRDLSSSVELLAGLLRGSVPAVPRISTSAVDVRDVADLHLRAMTGEDAAGERFLAVADGPISFPEIARLMRTELGAAGAKVPTREIPDWVVRIGGLVNPQLRVVRAQLGRPKQISNHRARSRLGWVPRSNEEALLASAESLVRLGVIPG
ncbi:MAG: NAD-dependent epimerase/dehydratase family protein [Leifsonia sp.]